jgi:succinate dehydrogenase flavin-adding protein (antitoxin of CptAB toxin-antitoxin module)
MKEGRIQGPERATPVSHPSRKHGSVEVDIAIMVFYERHCISLVVSHRYGHETFDSIFSVEDAL